MKVKDHSVSGEVFELWECRQCALRFTQDIPEEAGIGRYYKSEDYISHTNTGKGLVNSLYQKVRNLTLNIKANLVIQHTAPQGKLLDLGAGTGSFVYTMKKKGWEVTGIEPDEGARLQAKRNYNLPLSDTSLLACLQPGSFDAITLWHVLEHVHALHDYMNRLKELLKTGGKIFIAVPNYQSLDQDIYQDAWAAYDVPRHLYHFSTRAMETLLKKHGLKLLQKKPMWFDSFYISLLSSKYKHGNTHWIGAVFTGFRSNFRAWRQKDRCSSVIYVIGK